MSLIHEEEEWVAIYKRNTAGWVALHPLARFVSLELTRNLNSRGEVSVGRAGLPALAALLGAPWELIADHVEKLLAFGHLEYDEARRVVRDPQHVARQTAARRQIIGSAIQLAKDIGEPERKALSNAERARNRRVRMKAQQLELPAGTPTLTLPIVTPTRVATVATRVGRDDRDAPPESGVISVASAPDLTEHLVTPEISLSLSDLKISKKRRERGVTAARDVVTKDAPLPELARAALEVASSKASMVLNADFVWRKFASHAARKRWRIDDITDRWDNWVDREIEFMRSRAQAPPSSVRATAGPGPGLIATRHIVEQRAQWERDAERFDRTELVAAARRAMQVFA